jgi:hypothetical protein
VGKLYVLAGFPIANLDNIINCFERAKILLKHNYIPYIMPHENIKKSELKIIYDNMRNYFNSPIILLSGMTFTDFLIKRKSKKAMNLIEKYTILKQYLDLHYIKPKE